jgi:predicted transcriptional regulator
MEKLKKLPDAEFEVMKVVWDNESPITTPEIMKLLGHEKNWKIQSLVSFMVRLVEKGFLRSEKHGKERTYYPIVSKAEYRKFETSNVVKQFHDSSFLNLVTTLYDDEALTDKDIDELLQWANQRRG